MKFSMASNHLYGKNIIENRSKDRETSKHNASLKTGDKIELIELTTIHGDQVKIPDQKHLIHLQFRRYAGCPVCNLHLRSVAKRHSEIVAAGINEVVVFYSTRETMLEFQNMLPFAAIADPEKKLYGKFGADRRMSPLAALNPRSWFTALNAIARSPSLKGAKGNGESTMGLPSDFLIDPIGRILALNYGERVDDHWSVDQLLNLAKSSSRST